MTGPHGVVYGLLACLLAAMAAAGPSQAEAWPAKPIHWVVPYAPGGINDVITRQLGARLQEVLGQPIIIENRAGSNSIIGAELVAKAAPDGYTMLTVIAAHAANATLYAGSLPYDPQKSFVPVSLVGIAPLVLAVNKDLPARTMAEFVAYARSHPGKISFGSSGIGSAAHLTSELLKQTIGADMVHVPYKGAGPALQALMGGEIQMLVDVPTTLMPNARGGRIAALGVFSAKRLPAAAEVPTVAEAGGPAIEAATWLLFLAPAGTAPGIVSRLSGEVGKLVARPDIRALLESQGIEPVGGTPDDAARFLAAEIAKWAKVITAAGVKPE